MSLSVGADHRGCKCLKHCHVLLFLLEAWQRRSAPLIWLLLLLPDVTEEVQVKWAASGGGMTEWRRTVQLFFFSHYCRGSHSHQSHCICCGRLCVCSHQRTHYRKEKEKKTSIIHAVVIESNLLLCTVSCFNGWYFIWNRAWVFFLLFSRECAN